MRALTFAPLLLLASCQTTQAHEPVIRTIEVRVPFDDPACARAAVERLDRERVAFPDSDEALRAAQSVFEGTQLLVAGRLLRIAREASLSAALRACAG